MGRKLNACVIMLMLLCLVVSLTGCGNKKSVAEDERLQAQSADDTGMIQSADPKQVADHLEQLARGIPGVNNANCVVFGKYAIVGIDVDETLERSQVGTTKYAVAEAFRKDPYGIDAVVTADIDLAQRLREIRVDMRNGRPISGFAEEMADIVGRLIPQIPRNIIPPKQPENMGTDNLQQINQ